MSDSLCTPNQVQEAFINSPPVIQEQILDLSVKHPNFNRDAFDLAVWPNGAGTQMQQLVFRAAMPQIERGLDGWRKQCNNTGCNPGAGPDCAYNFTELGGTSFDRKVIELMARDYRSPSYCVTEIQTTAAFKEVFAKIVETLFAQVSWIKEFNIGQNVFTMLAKKFLVDSGGPKPNAANPYVYRSPGTATLSNLNIQLLEFFYERLRRLPSAVPYDVIDGAPIYALQASSQLLQRMWRDDANLRQDLRFSSWADAQLVKYNFISSIRGMFLPVPTLYPRRFVVSNSEFVEVLPFINGIPAEVGTYTGMNEDYEAATHEEILIHGKQPFKVYYQNTEASLGSNSSFGPEPGFLENWVWVNPQTDKDPLRRCGHYVTSARIGISPQYSEGMFGIIVERPSVTLMAQFNPVADCPPEAAACDNEVPAISCPCPLILDVVPHPLTAGTFFFSFATPQDVDPDDTLEFQLESGGSVTATVVDSSSDGLTIEATLPDGVDLDTCNHFVAVACSDGRLCSSDVLTASDCRSDQTGLVDVVLEHAIKADATETVTAFFGDCTSASMTVVAVDATQNKYTLQYGSGAGPSDDSDGSGGSVLEADLLCDRKGILRLCVPTATDATCPACGDGSLTLDVCSD